MYLKRLEIQGFKSFARATTLEFEPGVTSIVGPNGSGKSNVSDAVRWVLGEQSAKLMRGKKSDDVIFAGSDKKTKLGFAEVVATFDNSDRKIPVDAPEVSIGRRIDRTGESEYLINGTRVRLLDIVELVLKSNIGTSRYTVIGQGTIDQMILAGPAEIKNLLDEASGVKTYYIKRDKTLKRLETTAQNLMRAEDVINEIEPRLKSLRRQAKRMEARSEFETELRVYQREWYSKQYHTLAQEIGRRSASLEQVRAQRSHLEHAIQLHVGRLEAHEAAGAQSGQQFSVLRDELQRFTDQKNRLLESMSMVRGKMESFKGAGGGAADAQTLTIELHGIRRKAEELNLKLSGIATEEAQLAQSIGHLRSQIETVEQSLNQVYATLSHPETIDVDQITAHIQSLDAAFSSLFTSLQEADSLDAARAEARRCQEVFSSFKSKTSELLRHTGSAEHTQSALQDLSKQKDQFTRELHALESSLSRAKVSKEFLETERADLDKQALHLELELKKSSAGTNDAFIQDMMAEEQKIKLQLERLAAEIIRVETAVKNLHVQDQAAKDQLAQSEREFRLQQDELGKLRDVESGIQVKKARLDTQMEVLVGEISGALGAEAVYDIQRNPSTAETPDLEERIQKLKHQLDLIGGVDELTLQEYKETEERYGTLTGQVQDLHRGIQDLRQIIDELDEHIKTQFSDSFDRINEKFEFYFRMLFNGGRGSLTIIRAKDESAEEEAARDEQTTGEAGDVGGAEVLRPEEKMLAKYEQGANNIVGIDIKATPPGKKLASIQALSGGERALTSIALLCAMLACFPSPFVVLDEVDAALDDANTIRFGQILGTLAHQTQFVTITHNRETMAQSNTLYGVTMGDDGISKILSVKFDQATAYAK